MSEGLIKSRAINVHVDGIFNTPVCRCYGGLPADNKHREGQNACESVRMRGCAPEIPLLVKSDGLLSVFQAQEDKKKKTRH